MFYSLFLVGALIFAFLMLFIISSAFFGFLITRVPFIPTTARNIEFIVKELRITSKDIFYDLGSGNGKVVFLVEKLSGAKVKGFEQVLWTHFWALISKFFCGSKAILRNKNFFKVDWSEATIIYGYLYPMIMGRVEEKFKANCKLGTVAIIRDFPFPNMPYKNKYYLPDRHEMYVYKLE